MDAAQTKDLVAVLLTQGSISNEQASSVRLAMASTGKSALDALKDVGVMNEELVARAQAVVWGIPYFDQPSLVLSPELLNLIPRNLADTYNILPLTLDREKNIFEVIMANPQDLSVIDFFEKRAGFKLKPYLAPVERVKQLIEQNYAQSLLGEVSEVIKRGGEVEEEAGGVITVESMAQLIKEPKIVEIVKKILEHAIKLRATDIHIEPSESVTRIRYRIDGILQEKLRLDRQYHAALVSRIKILSNMKIDERRLPQDGRFTFKTDGTEVDLRISSLPTVHGEKVAMRLLSKSVKVPTLQDLGLRGKALKNLEESVLIPHGIILITGPTGSGKTDRKSVV